MSRLGTPIFKPNDKVLWSFWLPGKDGFESGTIWARTARTAVQRIKEEHGEAPSSIFPYPGYDDAESILAADAYNDHRLTRAVHPA